MTHVPHPSAKLAEVVAGRDDRADDVLAERVRHGDVGAYETLFRAYYRALCEFAVTYVRSSEQAEEVVQDVMGAVWAGRAKWVVQGSVRAYLFGAVRNRAFNLVARDRTARRWVQRGDDSELDATAADQHPDAQTVLEQAETTEALDQVIAALPPGRRTVLVLRVRHEMSYAEIAAVLGTSVKNVEVQLRRAVAALKVALPNYLK